MRQHTATTDLINPNGEIC